MINRSILDALQNISCLQSSLEIIQQNRSHIEQVVQNHSLTVYPLISEVVKTIQLYHDTTNPLLSETLQAFVEATEQQHRLLDQIVREYTYVYAVVAPEEGKMTSLILPSADTAMMNLFLEHVSRTFLDYLLVIQVDQAGWHNAKDLIIPENIRLISQPAYSPELNPVEHIWDEIREKAFPNRAFPSLDAVTDTLCYQLMQLEDNERFLRSMTYFPHFRMAS